MGLLRVACLGLKETWLARKPLGARSEGGPDVAACRLHAVLGHLDAIGAHVRNESNWLAATEPHAFIQALSEAHHPPNWQPEPVGCILLE